MRLPQTKDPAATGVCEAVQMGSLALFACKQVVVLCSHYIDQHGSRQQRVHKLRGSSTFRSCRRRDVECRFLQAHVYRGTVTDERGTRLCEMHDGRH